ncbi:MAG: serine hydrolase, partial [Deltaproteobacteria bacterium]|nr:serine hydrolase [Deltaproteobacteria bacterium]
QAKVVSSPQVPSLEVFAETSALLKKGVEDAVFPGAVLLVANGGQVIFKEAAGFKSYQTSKNPSPLPMTIDTVFDVASLTATVITTTILMKLVEANQIRLDDRISRYIQPFGVFGKSPITLAQVLTHRSGLPHWMPFYEDLLRENAGARMGILTSKGSREFIYNQINRCELKFEPGTKQVYSDVGLILLGHLVEVLTGITLEKAAQRYVIQPLGLKSTSFVDLSMMKRRGIHPVTDLIAPTEDCSWRKRMLCGEVHDDNAWAMGGIAGHSGLFSTAADMHLFCRELLAAFHRQSNYTSRKALEVFWAPTGSEGESAWRLGWDAPSEENGMNTSHLSKNAVGTCGFTGCSIWLEPLHGLEIVLMSNRVHPSRSNKKIRAFRPQIHDAILKAVEKL